jgi:hypothetical protein
MTSVKIPNREFVGKRLGAVVLEKHLLCQIEPITSHTSFLKPA